MVVNNPIEMDIDIFQDIPPVLNKTFDTFDILDAFVAAGGRQS